MEAFVVRVIAERELEATVVPLDTGGAFLYICNSIEGAQKARAADPYSDAIVALLSDGSENIQSALEEGVDRILENTSAPSIALLLRETASTWKRAEALRYRRLATQSILEHMSESVEITNLNVNLEYVNPAFEVRTGYPLSEAIGKTPKDLLRSTSHGPKLFEVMEATCLRGEVWVGEYLARGRNGKDDYILATIIPVLDHKGDIVKMAALKQSLRIEEVDVEAVDGGRRAILRLIKSEERYRKLVDAADDYLVIADFESGQVLNANRATVQQFGYTLAELRQKTIAMMSPLSEAKTLERLSSEIARDGHASEVRLRMCRKDGTTLWANAHFRVYKTHGQTCCLAVFRNISEEVEKGEQLEEANEKLLHAARLAAVGRLAAGVAHEINNPATFVKHNLEYLEEVLVSSPASSSLIPCTEVAEVQEAIADAMIGVDRIQSVTQQLLGFTRIHQLGKKDVDLRESLNVSLRFVRSEIQHCAELILEIQPVPLLWLDENKMGQLFVNLLVNAAHAIEEGQKDKNQIHVTIKEQDEHVHICIRDTGSGMTEEVRKQALVPFFSTKAAGKGTGLGLALCYETVAAHGGVLDIDSEEGVGTIINISLSIAKNQKPEITEEMGKEVPNEGRHRLRVLLVDDEVHILTGYKRVLSKTWDVVTVAGGQDTLDLLEEDQNYDLIVCDVMMPMVDGPAVLAAISEKYPELVPKFVFCTGAFTAQYQGVLESNTVPVLYKPISKEAFLNVSQLLTKATI